VVQRTGHSVNVFISYARKYFEASYELFKDLKNEGVNVWFDKESLLPGQNWENEIRKTIRNSKYFIAVLSFASVKGGVLYRTSLRLRWRFSRKFLRMTYLSFQLDWMIARYHIEDLGRFIMLIYFEIG
jgi:TIR domain